MYTTRPGRRTARPLIGLLLLPLALQSGLLSGAPSRAVEPIVGEPGTLLKDANIPPLGLPPLPVPASNPITAEKIALGRKLFFDRRLSFNRTLSCAMCHIPEQGFTQNELKTPVGIEGRFVKRNAPTLLNVGYRKSLFHDGRETSLENQVWQPLLKTNEMANPSIGFVIETIRSAPDYGGLFEAAFDRGPTIETIGMALASYERVLVSGNSPFDRWYFAGEADALSPAAREGWAIFQRSGCVSCHSVEESYAQFSTGAFYDTGIGYARSMALDTAVRPVRLAPGVEVVPSLHIPPPRANDLGRYEATGRSEDRWRYRTPSLRNVALTAPYMHDGSFASLESVVDYYNGGGTPHTGQDARIKALGLSRQQRNKLVAFLESLTGSNIAGLQRDGRSQAIGDVNQGVSGKTN